jgi:outer membrane protein assembly factor BamB
VKRRAALLGAATLGGAGLLGGCSTLEGWFLPARPRLPGERDAILAADSLLQPDPGLDAEPVTLPPPDARADWPQQGGNAANAPGHPAAADRLAVAWTASFGSGAGSRQRLLAQPVVAGGLVFAMDVDSQVSAFDAETGRRRWRIDARPENDRSGGLGGGLAVEGELLVAANGWAEVLGIAVADGSIAWRRRLPAPARGAPAVYQGRAFVATVEGQLTATQLSDGAPLWTWRGATGGTGLLGIPAPAVDAGSVVAAFASGELAALRPDNGRLLWVESLASTGGLAPISELSSVRAAPAIAGGRVIALAAGGLFVSLDQRSGRRVWEREIAGHQSFWLAGDWIFALTTGQELAAFLRRDGRAKWVTAMDRWRDAERKRGPIRWTGPALAGDRLILGNSEGRAAAVSPYTGEVLGTQRLPGPVSLPAIAAAGTVFMATDDATLVALR